VGDKLILTKPLGTGTLFAADMRGLAQGLWVKKAIVSMRQSNLQASKILQQFGATACTDVTGFGLAGHLMEMLQASRTNALLSLASLPVLDGAVDCIQSGILSTLHAQNRQIEAKLATWLSFNERGCEHSPALLEVIFDPQTAGGLLAGIAADQAESCLKRLHDAGYKKAVIVAEVVSQR
jgi:selenide,water dikinase